MCLIGGVCLHIVPYFDWNEQGHLLHSKSLYACCKHFIFVDGRLMSLFFSAIVNIHRAAALDSIIDTGED